MVYRQDEHGFTLMEVLFTIAVVAVVILGSLSASVKMQQVTRIAHERAIAVQDANQVIELMRQTAKSGTFPGNVTAVYSNGGTVSGFSNLTGEAVTVNYADAAANPLDVTVTVSWQENGLRTETESLESLITQRA